MAAVSAAALFWFADASIRSVTSLLETTVSRHVRVLDGVNHLLAGVNRLRLLELELHQYTDYFAISGAVGQVRTTSENFERSLFEFAEENYPLKAPEAAELTARWSAYKAGLERVRDAAAAVDRGRVEAISTHDSGPRFGVFIRYLEDLSENLETAAQREYVQAVDELKRRRVVVAWTFTLSLGVALLLAFLQSRSLFVRVRELRRGATHLARGHEGGAVPLRANDEITDLARLFNVMAERVRKRERDLRAARDDLDARVVERTRELEASHEQLRQAQRIESVGRLAGGIAHDFNNLLQVILGLSEQALEDGREDLSDDVRHSLAGIHRAGERAANLTRQLLAFSRKQILEPRVVDPNALVADLGKMLERLIGEDIELVARLDPGVCRIKVDPGQFEQVIVNLVVNARDAMPTGGRLTVETATVAFDEAHVRSHPGSQSGVFAMLSVRDTGCGMDRDTAEKIFEPFFTTKERGKGTGLGLATVYGIVKQSGGHIWVDSKPGAGATFTVYFPEVHAAPDSRALEIERSFSGRETVLLVEDEPEARSVIRQLLEGSGYQVLEAGSAQEALQQAAEPGSSFELLLTDVVMPGMGGRELADLLQARRPNLEVLFMSGYTDDAIACHGILKPGRAFLQKPVTRTALLGKVRSCLRPRRSPGDMN